MNNTCTTLENNLSTIYLYRKYCIFVWFEFFSMNERIDKKKYYFYR